MGCEGCVLGQRMQLLLQRVYSSTPQLSTFVVASGTAGSRVTARKQETSRRGGTTPDGKASITPPGNKKLVKDNASG